MFSDFKNIFSSMYKTISSKLNSLFSTESIDEATIKEIEKILLEADTGVKITKKIINELKQAHKNGIVSGQDAKNILQTHLTSLLITSPHIDESEVILLVGVNGSGKTTTTGKLSAHFQNQNKKVLMIAADTFRAAATQQLELWAKNTQAEIVKGAPEQDPASVVFTGCKRFKEKDFDILLIDTAGRLQTKINLMKELEKIKRVIEKALPDKKITTLLTVDAMLGQNSLEQARLFNESTSLNGIILTKIDGTAKGGIIFAISNELKIPITLLSYGEKANQLKIFHAKNFIEKLLE